MVKIHTNHIEISPLTPSIQFQQEQLIINLIDRRISSIHVYDPGRSEKYLKQVVNTMKYYNVHLQCTVLEIIDTPNKKNSPSLKTCTHFLLYYNPNDLNNDFNKIKSVMFV